MNGRRTMGLLVLGAVGLLLLVGVVLFFVPGRAAAVPIPGFAVDLGGFVAVGLAAWVARSRYRSAVTWTSVPAVEFPLATPTPGDEIDDQIYRLSRLREGTLKFRERIHARVRDVAASVLSHRRGCSYEEALDEISDGGWPADPRAATFFATDGKGGRPGSIFARLKRRVTGDETAYERYLEATVTAIETERASDSGDDAGPRTTGTTPSRDGQSVADDRSSADERRAMFADDVLLEGESTAGTASTKLTQTNRTGHWLGISAFALLAIGVGVFAASPALLLGSAVAVALAGYARTATVPSVADLAVERTVSDEHPSPGETIEVTVSVENATDGFLPDLRLVDRVPPSLRVVDGSPRLGTALRPGATATFSYRLEMGRGTHAWPVQVLGRDPSGSVERNALLEAETTVRCAPQLRTAVETPVRPQTSAYSGEVDTQTGSDGLEFFSTREYQPGDPRSRIDWKTYARNGELTTVEFREERAARIVLLFDGRASSYVSPRPGTKHALDRAVEAAFDVFPALQAQGHLVGVAGFNGIPCWLAPGSGDGHRQRARNLFADHPAISTLPPEIAEPEEGRYVDPLTHVRRQLPSNTQLFLFSPLADEYASEVARRLDGAGHLVTVISPDPTADRTIGHRIARLERTVRITRLRNEGVRVVDWTPDTPLASEFERAQRRWAR